MRQKSLDGHVKHFVTSQLSKSIKTYLEYKSTEVLNKRITFHTNISKRFWKIGKIL